MCSAAALDAKCGDVKKSKKDVLRNRGCARTKGHPIPNKLDRYLRDLSEKTMEQMLIERQNAQSIDSDEVLGKG